MINKNRKTLQILFLIKDLDPIFFEFLTDNIEYPNKKLTFTKDKSLKINDINIIFFFIYCNIFSTKQLNIQLQNKTTADRAKDNLLHYINKGKQRLIPKALNINLKQQLQKSFFLIISQTKYNQMISSQVLTSIETLKSFNLV
uniref:Uncharacterized protein n=1 Tax=Laminaria ephemera TaxID=309364 RepID=A0A8F0F994_9PHAE|nr:hypothetical protein [Laminaria ephemera]